MSEGREAPGGTTVRKGFLLGLFLTALATLTLEILDTRLLSVVTWYHLSFFAVSTAMLGMSAGAVRVYLGGDAFAGDEAPPALARTSLAFALAVPICGVINLCIPIPAGAGVATVATTAAPSAESSQPPLSPRGPALAASSAASTSATSRRTGFVAAS